MRRARSAALALAVVSAAAIAGPLDQALGTGTAREWGATFVVSLIGSVASMLWRLDGDQQARAAKLDGAYFNPKAIIRGSRLLFAGSHISGGLFSGLVAFVTAQAQTTITSGWSFLGAILVLSAGGAMGAERITAGRWSGGEPK